MIELTGLPENDFAFRSRLAEVLFEDEWRKAGDKKTRKILRDRAWVIMELSRRMNRGQPIEALEVTEAKPETVEIATPKDADGLLDLVQESDRELAIVSRNYEKVRDVIGLAVDRTPLVDADGSTFMRPVFGVVVDDGKVVAACGLFPTQPWDSLEFYLRGFYLYVGSAARRSHHGKSLLQFSNWFGDRTAMPVVWEALACGAFDERARMFARHAAPFGGFFIHRPVEGVAA